MVYILWDASDLWGALAVWGVKGLGLPYRVVRAHEIANGLLEREKPRILLVPGGFGRHKGQALGEAGQEAVRRYVHSGGAYVGFCGGAGLALADEHGIALCPWHRAGYVNRIQHYMSGHFFVTVTENPLTPAILLPAGKASLPLLPVWWPGRFAPVEGGDVKVLAAYDTPGPDFWLADLPVASLPHSIFVDWEEKYGFSPSPSFLHKDPCVIQGTYGKGTYVLAYTHLETPESPDANAWLAHIAITLGMQPPLRLTVPAWDLEHLFVVWEAPALAAMWRDLQNVLDAGFAAGLFFTRSSWLMGWRTGIPGAVLNTVRAHLYTILSLPPSPEAVMFWEKEREKLVPAFHTFAERAQSYLLAERLAMTLSKDLPEALAPEKLLAERVSVFGASGMAAHTGGLLGRLLPFLDELAFLQLRR